MDDRVKLTVGNAYECGGRVFVVTARTSKTVTVEDPDTGRPIKSPVRVYDGVEYCRPLGKTIDSPTLRADSLETGTA